MKGKTTSKLNLYSKNYHYPFFTFFFFIILCNNRSFSFSNLVIHFLSRYYRYRCYLDRVLIWHILRYRCVGRSNRLEHFLTNIVRLASKLPRIIKKKSHRDS